MVLIKVTNSAFTWNELFCHPAEDKLWNLLKTMGEAPVSIWHIQSIVQLLPPRKSPETRPNKCKKWYLNILISAKEQNRVPSIGYTFWEFLWLLILLGSYLGPSCQMRFTQISFPVLVFGTNARHADNQEDQTKARAVWGIKGGSSHPPFLLWTCTCGPQ